MTKPEREKRLIDRMEAKINRTATCWNWLGSKNEKGYGYVSLRGKRTLIHRYAYTQLSVAEKHEAIKSYRSAWDAALAAQPVPGDLTEQRIFENLLCARKEGHQIMMALKPWVGGNPDRSHLDLSHLAACALRIYAATGPETNNLLKAYGNARAAEARVAGIEEAAKWFDGQADAHSLYGAVDSAREHRAQAGIIRALKAAKGVV